MPPNLNRTCEESWVDIDYTTVHFQKIKVGDDSFGSEKLLKPNEGQVRIIDQL